MNVGSSSEYGHRAGPIREADPLAPRTDYAVSKAAATLLCQSEALRGRPVTTVRVFSAYGPGEDPRRLVPDVMSSCLRGHHPEVTDGRQPRDFIFIDDVLSLLETAAHCPAACGEILHAAQGAQHTVHEMIEMIVSISGVPVAPCYGALASRVDEPSSWVAQIDRTCELTGWRPKFDLRSGVKKTWSWFVSIRSPMPRNSFRKHTQTMPVSTQLFSLVVPVLNEEEVLRTPTPHLAQCCSSIDMPFEVIVVDNGSTDATPALMAGICATRSALEFLRLSRNFGYQNSITAGMLAAQGDAIMVIDADLQDPPELIPQFIRQVAGRLRRSSTACARSAPANRPSRGADDARHAVHHLDERRRETAAPQRRLSG